MFQVEKCLNEGMQQFQSFQFEEARANFSNAIEVGNRLMGAHGTNKSKLVGNIIVAHRMIGLTQLYQSKRMLQDPEWQLQAHKESMEHFTTSLDWGELNHEAALENIQILSNIFFNELSLNNSDISVNKLRQEESFLKRLTTSVNPESMAQTHHLVCQIWICFSKRFLKFLSQSLFFMNANETMTMLGNIKTCIDITIKQVSLRRSSSSTSETLQTDELLKIHSEICGRSTSLQALYCAKKLMKKSLDTPDEDKKVDLLLISLDKLKEAEQLLVPIGDEKLLCWILTEMGLIHLQLQNRKTAKSKFEQAIRLANFRREDLTEFSYFKTATQNLEIIRNAEFEEKQRKLQLEEDLNEIRLIASIGLVHFLPFILKKHPPIHNKKFESLHLRENLQSVSKKVLVKIISCYHTDKIDQVEFGENYFSISEEILKNLNREFNLLK